jgi:exosome complex component RRP43
MTETATKASIFQRLHPRVYFERFVSVSIRPDGRDFDAWRDVSVNVGMTRSLCEVGPIHLALLGSISTADGSALIRLGETTIVCGVKAEIAEPELDRPGEGFLGEHPYELPIFKFNQSSSCAVPNLDLPAICSPKFKPGPPTEEAQVLSDRLNEALIACAFLGFCLRHPY